MNVRLRAAREASGCANVGMLHERLADFAAAHGIRRVPSERQLRKWERETPPPFPRFGDYRRLLLSFFGVTSLTELGFSAEPGDSAADEHLPAATQTLGGKEAGARVERPARTYADYMATVAVLRRMYQTVDPEPLHGTVLQFARLGDYLLQGAGADSRQALATAVAENALLAGRIEFFDLGRPEAAAQNLRSALQAAWDADESLLGAAILGHLAFLPGWAGDMAKASDRLRAAHAYARKAGAPGRFRAWLYAVEAECQTRCGNHRQALATIRTAEDTVASSADDDALPAWFTWFSAAQLASFRGNIELRLGHAHQAADTLNAALGMFEQTDADDANTKQRAVILADLAAAKLALRDPDEACAYLLRALDLLDVSAYETAMDRVRDVRRALDDWPPSAAVHRVDDRLYRWEALLNGMH